MRFSAKPVVDDPRHLGEVLRFGFPLHQRRRRSGSGTATCSSPSRCRAARPARTALRWRRSASTGCPAAAPRVDVPRPRRDQTLQPAMVVAHRGDRLDRPFRHRQRRRRALPAASCRSSTDTQCRSPSRSTHVALEIRLKMPSVTALVLTSWMSSSWRPFGNHQLADPVLRIGKPRNGIGRRYLGAHLVEAGLDGRDGGVALRRHRRMPSTVATTLCSCSVLPMAVVESPSWTWMTTSLTPSPE